MSTYGERRQLLIITLQEMNLSQGGLARATGISQPKISRMVRGDLRVSRVSELAIRYVLEAHRALFIDKPRPMRHPGEILAELLNGAGYTTTKAADEADIQENQMASIFDGRSEITDDVAAGLQDIECTQGFDWREMQLGYYVSLEMKPAPVAAPAASSGKREMPGPNYVPPGYKPPTA